MPVTKKCIWVVLCLILSACGENKTVTNNTIIQTRYSTSYIPFLRYTTVYIPVVSPPEPVTQPPPEPVVQPPAILSDATGTIHLQEITPIENFRTQDRVNFSTRYKLYNSGVSRVNFHWTVYGLTAADDVVFTRLSNHALDGGKTNNLSISYGEPLTISEYDSITKWIVTDLAIN